MQNGPIERDQVGRALGAEPSSPAAPKIAGNAGSQGGCP
jgi:hypothetical protein